MDRFTLAEFAKNSENKEDASFTPQVQEAGIEQGALIVSRLYNTMLGEITKTMKSWDAELTKVLEEGGITPSALTNEQLYNAILRIINRTHGRNIGDVYYSQSSSAEDNPGALPLFTGELVSNASNSFPEFCAWLSAHPNLCITQAQYDTRISQYGECPFYVYNVGADIVRLPKLVNYVKMANTNEGVTQSEAGLPQHTHTYTHANIPGGGQYQGAGAQYGGPSQMVSATTGGAGNAIYGNSTTVTPAHTTLFPWVTVYNVARPASEAQAAEFIGSLSGKADIDLGNVNSSGSSKSAGWAMPSTEYENITVGASGAIYTAPANGYYSFATTNTSTQTNYTYLVNETTGVCYYAMANAAVVARGFVPVKKGQQVSLGYFNSTIATFRFVYAEGSKSEAN